MPQKAFAPLSCTIRLFRFSATGTFYQFPGAPAAVPIHAEATMPQTVEALLTVPLTPTWINTAFVKWADWSIWKRVPVVLSEDAGPGLPTGTELSALNFYFRDGWTLSDQISHVLTKDLTVFVRLSWDRGVATGWDEYLRLVGREDWRLLYHQQEPGTRWVCWLDNPHRRSDRQNG